MSRCLKECTNQWDKEEEEKEGKVSIFTWNMGGVSSTMGVRGLEAILLHSMVATTQDMVPGGDLEHEPNLISHPHEDKQLFFSISFLLSSHSITLLYIHIIHPYNTHTHTHTHIHKDILTIHTYIHTYIHSIDSFQTQSLSLTHTYTHCTHYHRQALGMVW